MKVYLRAASARQGHHFTDAPCCDIQGVISEIRRAGGVFYDGKQRPILDHQVVLDDNDGAYVEIIVDDNED